MKKYDLALNSRGNAVAWKYGFFEEIAQKAGTEFDESKFFTIEKNGVMYRINKYDYSVKVRKEAFDKFLNR